MSYIATGVIGKTPEKATPAAAATAAGRGEITTSAKAAQTPINAANAKNYYFYWYSVANRNPGTPRTQYGPAELSVGFIANPTDIGLQQYVEGRHGGATAEATGRVIVAQVRERVSGITILEITRAGGVAGAPWVTTKVGNALTGAGVQIETVQQQTALRQLIAAAAGGDMAANTELQNNGVIGRDEYVGPDGSTQKIPEVTGGSGTGGSSNLLLYGAIGVGVLALIFILKRKSA